MGVAAVRECDVAVVGAGVSGLTAAAQCAEQGASVVCIEEAGMSGGLIANIGKLDGFPAPGPLSGAALIDSMLQICKASGVTLLNAHVSGLAASGSQATLTTDQGTVVAKRVVVASGARLRQLGVPGEAELTGRGVSQCNWCDGGFFKNESVFVVGGGDAAFQAALHLAGFCASVTIVMRSSAMRARRFYIQTAADNERIAFHWDMVVERIIGSDRVEGMLLNNLAEGGKEEHPASGIFVFIGTEPNSGFLPPEIARDATGRVATNADYLSSLAGVYAIGGVRSGYRGQLLSACGEGAAAAAAVIEDLKRQELL